MGSSVQRRLPPRRFQHECLILFMTRPLSLSRLLTLPSCSLSSSPSPSLFPPSFSLSSSFSFSGNPGPLPSLAEPFLIPRGVLLFIVPCVQNVPQAIVVLILPRLSLARLSACPFSSSFSFFPFVVPDRSHIQCSSSITHRLW